MNKLFTLIFVLIFVTTGSPLVYAAAGDQCFTTFENVQVSGTFDANNNCITASGVGGSSANNGGQVLNGNGQPATPATQTTTPAPATPAPANTGCPNGGTQQTVIVNGQSVQGGCSLGYTPLEPIPGVTTGVNGTNLDFPTLLGNIYKIVITIGALFSVLMLTISGVRYMLSDVVTDKERAKKRITACLYGLVLIAASWLILNTINPQLVRFNLNPGTGVVNAPQAVAPAAQQQSSAVQTVPASSIQAPFTQALNPIEYSSQNSNDPSVVRASADFAAQCLSVHGSVISVPDANTGKTAETCDTSPGLF